MLPTEGEWLSVEEAAERLGLQPSSIRRLIAEGRLHAHRIYGSGGKDRARLSFVNAEDVERYRQEHLGQGAWKTRRKKPAEPAEENER